MQNLSSSAVMDHGSNRLLFIFFLKFCLVFMSEHPTVPHSDGFVTEGIQEKYLDCLLVLAVLSVGPKVVTCASPHARVLTKVLTFQKVSFSLTICGCCLSVHLSPVPRHIA